MKTLLCIPSCLLWFLLSCQLTLHPITSSAGIVQNENRFITIKGIVKDKDSKKTIPYASISLTGSASGTVTNADGEFTFKIQEPLQGKEIEIAHIGYFHTTIRLEENETDLQTVWLIPSIQVLDEVIVEGHDPEALIEAAVKKIPRNYSNEAEFLTGFYRETAQKRKRYINIAEAVLNIRKTSYTQDVERDRVEVLKGRNLVSPKPSDTLAVKLLGGPTTSIYLDIVKNPDLLLSKEAMPFYEYHMEEPVFIDRRMQYVVSFTPRPSDLPFALYYGKFYIDSERLSFTRAEFRIDLSDRDKAIQTILYKKPRGLRFKPVEVSYQINYSYRNGMTRLNYVRNEIRFRCDWKRKLFATGYTILSEMVVTDIQKATHNIPYKDSFRRNQILSDEASSFFDEDFWGDYNIIEPDESLEHAVHKLKK